MYELIQISGMKNVKKGEKIPFHGMLHAILQRNIRNRVPSWNEWHAKQFAQCKRARHMRLKIVNIGEWCTRDMSRI
jgi:hypothetical protein